MAGVLTWLFAMAVVFSGGFGAEWWLTHHGHVEWRAPGIVGHVLRVRLPDSLLTQRNEAVRALNARPVVREAKAAAISADVAQTITKTQAVYRDRFVTLTNEVQTYVPPEADRQCLVGVGVVRLLNAAAAGEAGVPAGAGGPVEASSGYELHDVAASVTGNYGVAHQWRAEALGWREWYAQQAAAWAQP